MSVSGNTMTDERVITVQSASEEKAIEASQEIVEKSSRPSAASSVENEEDEGVLPPRKMSNLVWYIIALSVLSSTFLFSLDNTIVANVQPAIIEDFGNIDKLPWLPVAFALGAISVSLTWGRLFDLFDTKKLYCVAVLFFEVGSAICGAAPNMNALIVGRTIAGLGGSGIYIGTINVFTGLTSARERPFYMSLVGAIYALGTILGPVIGGAFADSRASWRWAFYINICIAGLAAPVYLWLLPSNKPQPNAGLKELCGQIDFTGIVLFAGASVSLVMAIAFGGLLYSWNSGQIIGLFVCAGVLWILFALQQAFSVFTKPQNRLFPVKFLKSLQLCILFAQVASCITVVYVSIYFLPLYFQFVNGDSAVLSGAKLLPYCIVSVVAALLNGLVMARYGVYMPWFLVGGILIVIGMSLLHTITPFTPYSRVAGYGVISSFGMGMFVQAPYSVAQAKVEKEDIVNVTAFISTGQISGVVLSLAIASSVFLNRATASILHAFPGVPVSEIQAAIQGANSPLFDSLPQVLKDEVLAIVVKCLDEVFVTMIFAGAFSTVLSLFMKRERLNIASILPVGA